MIEDLHVCNMAILLIFEIYRQEVYVERIDVGASSSGQHLLEGAIAIAVTFERKDLLSRRGGEKGGMNSPMLVWNGWGGLYLALVIHKCAQVGGLVPGRCSGIDNNALRVRWWGEHDGGKTRCLILEDETSIRILGDICQARLRGKQQKVLDVRVPCEVPEKRGVGASFCR